MRDRAIRLANIAAITAIGLLIYWVFVFLVINVLGLKVFRENLTETFYLSALGIVALLGGALVVSVVLNLSKIADALAQATPPPAAQRTINKTFAWAIAFSFPITFALLYVGDLTSARLEEQRLIESAQTLIQSSSAEINQLANYDFSPTYIKRASELLRRLTRVDEQFPQVQAVVLDNIEGKSYLLAYSESSGFEKVTRADFIYPCSAEERRYLRAALSGKTNKPRFTADDYTYELYFPVVSQGRRMVLFLSKNSRYGNYGS